jgi:hypothetical protein
LIENERGNDNILETPEELRKTKKKKDLVRNRGKIQILKKMKKRKYFNKMHQMQAEKLKRTKTKMNKWTLKSKQKSNRIENLSKNSQIIPNDIQSETLIGNKISNFLKKILGVEEKARQKVERNNEKEEAALPDGDLKTKQFQKPEKRKVKKPKIKTNPKKKKSKSKKKGQKEKKLKKEKKSQKAKCQWFKNKLKQSEKKLKLFKDKDCVQTKQRSRTSFQTMWVILQQCYQQSKVLNYIRIKKKRYVEFFVIH